MGASQHPQAPDICAFYRLEPHRKHGFLYLGDLARNQQVLENRWPYAADSYAHNKPERSFVHSWSTRAVAVCKTEKLNKIAAPAWPYRL